MAQFQSNLERMSNEVTSAGATPIILTSLTRRKFNSAGVLDDSLADVTQAAKQAAAAAGVALLDLNAASKKYVQAIGEANADTYNYVEGDRTHLNERGMAIFARIVADLIVDWRKGLRKYITPDGAMSAKIARGEYV